MKIEISDEQKKQLIIEELRWHIENGDTMTKTAANVLLECYIDEEQLQAEKALEWAKKIDDRQKEIIKEIVQK